MLWKPQSSRQRHLVVTAIFVLVTSISLLLGLLHFEKDLWVAASILVISLFGFHAIAWLTYNCVWCWRFVDYPWVFATFMTILVALTNIYETSRIAPLATALAERKSAYEGLIYSLKSVITNDCHPKPSRAGMWSVSPEPYVGACDRMEHFLPQIEGALTREATFAGLNSGAGWGDDILIRDTDPVGSWAGLYEEANRFKKNDKKTQDVLDRVAKVPRSPIASWAQSNALKYWYFALAFFLGLRISKITADLLASRQARLPMLVKADEKGHYPNMADTPSQLEYLKVILDARIQRLHHSVDWYRRRFFITQMSTVVLSGTVTLLAGMKNAWITEAVASNSILILGAVITIVSAWGAFFAPRETWHMKADVLGKICGIRNKLLFASADPDFSADEKEALSKEIFDEFEKIMKDHNLKWLELRKK